MTPNEIIAERNKSIANLQRMIREKDKLIKELYEEVDILTEELKK